MLTFSEKRGNVFLDKKIMNTVTSQGKKYTILDKTINDGKIYQKIGKRYKPVRDCHAYDGLSKGCWLVRVDDGCTSICHSVTPDTAAVEHAFKIAEDKLVKILAKVSEVRMKLTTTALTEREIRAIAAYSNVMGEEKVLYFEYPSLYEMAKEIIRELTKKQP